MQAEFELTGYFPSTGIKMQRTFRLVL